MANELNFDDLFGDQGIIPLPMFSGMGEATCPYCHKLIRNINFPPPGVIIIHSCPVCNNLVIPFLKQLIAVRKEKLDDKEARKHITECIYNTISPILMLFANRFIRGESALKSFLDSCWNIVFELVGEKEDSESFLNKLKQRVIENKDHYLAKEYEEYFERMSQIFERVVSSKVRKANHVLNKRPHGKWTPTEMTEISKDLSTINTVDDFLRKFSDSVK